MQVMEVSYVNTAKLFTITTLLLAWKSTKKQYIYKTNISTPNNILVVSIFIHLVFTWNTRLQIYQW
jgi:hypothetical protein